MGVIVVGESPLCEFGSLKEISVPNDRSDLQSTRRGDGNGNWYLLQEALCDGDFILHYNSQSQRILGLSEVVKFDPSRQRGQNGRLEHDRGVCSVYEGMHLSFDHFSEAKQQQALQYHEFREVHVRAITPNIDEPRILSRCPQSYIVDLSYPGTWVSEENVEEARALVEQYTVGST